MFKSQGNLDRWSFYVFIVCGLRFNVKLVRLQLPANQIVLGWVYSLLYEYLCEKRENKGDT